MDNLKDVKKDNVKCKIIKKCRVCYFSDSDYNKQLEFKQNKVNKFISKYCKVEPIIGMKDPYHYRNKVHAVFDTDKTGNIISGVYEPGTHKVIPVEECLIEDKKSDEIIATIRGMLKSFKIKTYDEYTGTGLLRHVLIRTGFNSGEIMVVLVFASHIFPSKNNFIKVLLKAHPEITTIVMNVNGDDTTMVLGEREDVLYGKGYITDTLCGKVFRISPKSFYQVNPVQTEVLYRKAIDLASFKGNETVIDAYCGIGTIGIIASDYVKNVIGVELNRDAVKDAIVNAKQNDIKNIYFHNLDAGDFMDHLANEKQKVDVVLLDPPRSGSTEKFLSSLCALSPKKVVYVSCNPVSLERDLSFLTSRGYVAKRAIPVDMFPMTEHVETLVLMSKK